MTKRCYPNESGTNRTATLPATGAVTRNDTPAIPMDQVPLARVWLPLHARLRVSHSTPAVESKEAK